MVPDPINVPDDLIGTDGQVSVCLTAHRESVQGIDLPEILRGCVHIFLVKRLVPLL